MANFSVGEIFGAIDEMAPQFKIDPTVAKSIILAENTRNGRVPPRSALFSGDATNKNDTMGIGQVIPTTAEGLKQAGFLPADWKHDPSNLKSQLAASLATMSEMKGRLRNPDDPLELGAYYNGGNNGWNAYKNGQNLVPETANYLQKMRTSMAELPMTPQQREVANDEYLAAKQSGQPAPADSGSGPRMYQSNRSSMTTTRNVFDEGALENYNKANSILTAPGGLYDQALAAIDDRKNGIGVQGPVVVQSILQAGQDAGATASAQAMLKAAGEERRAAILSRANLNPSQTNNRMDQALGALDETSARLEQMKPEIDRRMSVGFFDNPLEWLVNQTRLPGMVGEYNGLVGQQKDALQKYQAAKDITTSSIDMSQAIDADRTLETGAAISREAISRAQQNAELAKLQMMQKSTSDALAAVQVGNQAAATSLQQLMLSKQAESIRQGESEAEARSKGEQAALSEFNKLVIAAGGQGLAYDRFKQLTPKAREEILSANSTGRFGGDFVSALKFVEKYGNLDNMAIGGQAAVRTWINKTDTTANEEVNKLQTKALAMNDKSFNPTKAKEATFNALAAQYEAAANGNMRGVPEGNPYKIDYKSFINAPDLVGNAYVDMLKKYGPDGTEKQFTSYDEQEFMKRAVTTARLSGDPAASVKKLSNDISSFYKAASKQQQLTTKPQMFGLATPVKTYPVALPQYATGSMPKVLDLGNPVEMENFLTRQVAKEIAEQNPYSIAGARASSADFGISR